ncbi:MAG TPA: M67 family metallopeptidase [Ignavibacteriaceae bacterium]|nr:M67 family metallopeptidase [Ignavibacteriaceae bacterium]
MIKIPGHIYHGIYLHGEETYNEECCGAIFGYSNEYGKDVREIMKFKNEKDESRQNRYLISPAEYLSAEKTAKEKNLELIGFYHSHPDHPAVPSKFDTDHAFPWFLYIIVSVQKGKAADLRGWTLEESREKFNEEILEKIKLTVEEKVNY